MHEPDQEPKRLTHVSKQNQSTSPAVGAAGQELQARSGAASVATTGLMLFALFFGAGNLIFPPVLGASAGQNLPVVMAGFLLTGVLLPLVSLIAVSTSGEGVLGLANRVGKRFGAVMPAVVYLAIGPLYAIPRVATVSYELATKPVLALLGYAAEEHVLTVFGYLVVDPALALHAAVFFAMTLFLAITPSRLADRVGRYLTPLLLLLIAVLCVAVLLHEPVVERGAEPGFDVSPFATGLTRGYFTMDVLGAIVFGLVVISAVREQGFTGTRQVVRATSGAAAISALLLGLVYLGLALVGARVAGDPGNGTKLLSTAAQTSLGVWGTLVFAGIVLLACVTTAVGLLAAWAGYATSVLRLISFERHVVLGALVSFLLANLGLELILRIVSPVTLLLYPAAIALVVVTILDGVAPGHLRLTYVGATATASLLGVVSALADVGVTAPSSLLARTGLWNDATGWILPTLLVAGACLWLDVRAGRWSKPASDMSGVTEQVERAVTGQG
ncbi:branched-chain amino acid transport system II carrier protein [Actinomyces weissii]|uniref:Branched-chain amino acid transport system II carrier protein n=1 Tax=Actinomyces weissii TaxID=675090 RepID=A0A7T7MAN6_9ACTO|nr:branched-chain amino acid transport system II carrier protein [Actinomyces weissii]